MRGIFKILAGVALLMLVATVTVNTGNLMAGLLAGSAATVATQYLTGFTLFELQGHLGATTALIGIKRKTQMLTIGGAKRLYIVLTEDLLNEFLNYDLVKSAGEFTGAIPLVTGKKFVELEAWYDSTKFDTEMKIGGGYTQSLEFKFLGYNAETVKLSGLLYETPVNFIVQGNDDKLYYIGQKYIPMMCEMKGTMPEKGTARKETTFMAKQDGMQVPIMPLGPAVTFDVTPLVTP
ncbi:hypothetical protein [Salmonirosea aquatica]|uniref:Uncharacterized protein n=1 Tax=Salmonirosea aquatica TaxID=2654236 RepID=A0A7C9BKS2_9BACT|nr:hypothetical protein [Cytophagaceae bacterium SJW1-29]